MARAKKVQKVAKEWKRKRWYKILAPRVLNEAELGETLSYQDQSLLGKTITANLFRIMRDIKKQNINVTFEINKIVGDNALTKIKKYEIMPAAVKRMVRRKRDRIDDSFVCSTSDNIAVRIKPLILTRSLSKSSQKLALLKMTREHVMNNVKKLSYDALVHEVVTGKLQKGLRSALSKIFPIKSSEIRVMEAVTPAKAKKAEKAEEAREEAKPKEVPTTKVEEKKEEKAVEKREEKPKKEKEEKVKEAKKEVKKEEKKEVKEERPAEEQKKVSEKR